MSDDMRKISFLISDSMEARINKIHREYGEQCHKMNREELLKDLLIHGLKIAEGKSKSGE